MLCWWSSRHLSIVLKCHKHCNCCVYQSWVFSRCSHRRMVAPIRFISNIIPPLFLPFLFCFSLSPSLSLSLSLWESTVPRYDAGSAHVTRRGVCAHEVWSGRCSCFSHVARETPTGAKASSSFSAISIAFRLIYIIDMWSGFGWCHWNSSEAVWNATGRLFEAGSLLSFLTSNCLPHVLHSVQEISKVPSGKPIDKTFFVWSVHMESVLVHFRATLYKTMFNLAVREQHEKEVIMKLVARWVLLLVFFTTDSQSPYWFLSLFPHC